MMEGHTMKQTINTILSDSIEQHLDNLMEELIKTERYDIMASCLNQCNGTYSNYEKYKKILGDVK